MIKHLSLHRLTREQFRALARDKGWKFKMLAERWGVTPEWVSIISRDPNRDIRFDDALFGLPDLNYMARDLRRRETQIERAVTRYQASGILKPGDSIRPGYRYKGYLCIETIVATTAQFGSLAEENERGIVFCILDNGQEENYGVIFERGGVDWFTPALVDTYLASTGLISTSNIAYSYTNEITLQADFCSGRFNFWPATQSLTKQVF